MNRTHRRSSLSAGFEQSQVSQYSSTVLPDGQCEQLVERAMARRHARAVEVHRRRQRPLRAWLPLLLGVSVLALLWMQR